jgi:inosine-uridine nucleoside N-ribohydrolase
LAGGDRRRVLLDTDISLGTPGAEIDDGAALIALVAAEGAVMVPDPAREPPLHDAIPESPLIQAITTVHGNVGPELAMHNLRRLLSYLERTGIPVGLGAAQPLVGDKGWFDAWQMGYGRTPPWPAAEEIPAASELIVQTIHENPGISILAIGPLTNLALALRIDPTIVSKVGSLFVMGGSFEAAAAAGPEFNIRCDPQAAQLVLNGGWPLRMLGLELTQQIFFSRADFAALPQTNGALDLLRRQAPGWIDRVEGQGWEQGGCSLHDAVAVAAFLDESLFEWREVSVSVELMDPEARGRTSIVLAGEAGSVVRVAVGCDVEGCFGVIWGLLNN